MATTIDQEEPLVVLHDISWEMYEKILESLGEYHLRHSYADGTLEMRGILYGVNWKNYQGFLAAIGDYSLRHTFDGWHLEMMSPRKDHDWIKRLIGRMIEVLTYELRIPIQSVGSTTLTGDEVTRGVQPDEAYYIANESVVRGKSTYDPAVDPPPDLVLEIDVTNSSVPRMPTFALLGIPEVWRHDRKKLSFHQRSSSGDYIETECSVAFPFLKAADLQRFIDQSGHLEENTLLRGFVDWAKQQRDQFNSSESN